MTTKNVMSAILSKSSAYTFAGTLALIASAASVRADEIPTVFDAHAVNNTVERTLTFDPTGTGAQLPACWGLDTAWNSNDNFVRGMRAMTPDIVDIVRVSFNPYALVTTQGVVPTGECANQLKSRMEKVAKVEALRTGNRKVDIAINLDAARMDLQGDYYYINNGEYDLNLGTKNHAEWAKLLHAYVSTIRRDYGNTVVSVAPFNEPDYYWNSLRQPHFDNINKAFRANYPDMQDVRISGGNTLNCDEAQNWYDYLKANLDEGNTHQLAGDFNHYASFFQNVRADGKYATGDELHNVMEAMVGIEYGMQTGIWWGEAARVRGQFCQASNLGQRLAYTENRYAWGAASVYKRDNHLSQAFVGVSERQGRPASYSFVSKTKDIYVDGVGPTREFVIDVPADANGTYQGAAQRNAEAVYDITWGEDVMPEINGTYYIISKANGRAVQAPSSATATAMSHGSMNATSTRQKWEIKKVRTDNGGDYSYFTIADANNTDRGWFLEGWKLSEDYSSTSDQFFATAVLCSNSHGHLQDGTETEYIADNCLWYLQYAGNGWFRIRSKVSDYCARPKKSNNGTIGNTAALVQAPYDADDDNQLFRFLPADNLPSKFETEAPAAPQGVNANGGNGSITISWNAVNDNELASYTLLRSDNGGEFNTIARNIAGTSIVDNTALAGDEYTYKVVAFDKSGNRSEASATASASIRHDNPTWAVLPFDDTLDDISGNSFHARASEDQAFTTGKRNSCLSPGASQTVMLPMGAVPAGGNFSVTAWVRTRSTGASGQDLFDFGTDETNHIGLLLNDGTGNIALRGTTSTGTTELKAKTPTASDWHHIAVVLSDSEWIIYVDGNYAAGHGQAGLSASVPDRTKVLNYIGRGMRQYDYNMNTGARTSIPVLGSIDEFHIYNGALTPTQVYSDMQGHVSAIDDLSADAPSREVVSREYFNLKGQPVAASEQGEPMVVRTVYSDGTVESSKEVITE